MTDTTPFEILSDILRPIAKGMIVKHDTDTNFYVEEESSGAKPQMFSAVQVKKNYTSLHIFPVYTDPSLLEGISPELKKRMQGKSCFNFKSADQIPTDEVRALLQNASVFVG